MMLLKHALAFNYYKGSECKTTKMFNSCVISPILILLLLLLQTFDRGLSFISVSEGRDSA